MPQKRQHFNYFRLLIQWTIIILLGYMVVRMFIDVSYQPDFEAYCPFGGIQALSSFSITHTLACSMTSIQIAMAAALFLAIILFSKLFCGYICPVGIISEWLGKLGSSMRIRYNVNGLLDRCLRILKYALFFITIYFTVESSELFCKKFDPYYATMTWFSGDVNFWWAIIAIGITVLGSILFRQFWCKYLCPLSAISNIFGYFFLFVVVMGSYIALLYFNLKISWIIPLAVLCGASFLFEATRLNRKFFPLFRITREDDSCSHCKLCDKACPQAIKISGISTVITDIDCNLCGDCLTVCPSAGTLKINRHRMNWLPMTATILITAAALYLGSTFEIPTVSEYWGNSESKTHSKVFEKSGLKDIKCYGSSMSFVAKMREVEGVLGVETYVGSHSVKIFYDPAIITEKEITEAIFTPTLNLIKEPTDEIKNLTEVTVALNNFFDRYDAFYLTELLKQTDGVYGFETMFGEPVIASIFIDPQKINPEKLKRVIESKSLTYSFNEQNYTEAINFKVVYIKIKSTGVGNLDFRHRMFNPYVSWFNSAGRYDSTEVEIYEIPMMQAANPELKRELSYLEGQLSEDTTVIGFETSFEDCFPIARISYLKKLCTPEKIFGYLNSDSLSINYDDGTIEKIKNPFAFSNKCISKAKSDSLKTSIDSLAH